MTTIAAPAALKPYYEQDGIVIYRGDCCDVLPELSGIDAVVTDPPYGVELRVKRAKHRGQMGQVERPAQYGHPDTPEYLSDVVIPAIQECRQLAPAVAVMPGSRNLWLYPPADDLGCFYSGSGTGIGRWGFGCFHPILYYGRCPYLRHGLGARPNSCGNVYPNDANRVDHPCAKPIGMMRWLVVRASLEGEICLDPFMGSGTTLVAAALEGRKAIGIEIDERYCEVAARRLDALREERP